MLTKPIEWMTMQSVTVLDREVDYTTSWIRCPVENRIHKIPNSLREYITKLESKIDALSKQIDEIDNRGNR